MRIPPHTLIGDLTQAHIDQINHAMLSEHCSFLRKDGATVVYEFGPGMKLQLHPQRPINNVWKLAEAIHDVTREPMESLRTCRVCGCSDRDCKGCIERTGRPCRWVEADLCSACAPFPETPTIKEIISDTEQPSRPCDFITHGSRGDAVRDCRRDFQSLPEWSYIIRRVKTGEWHVWRDKIPAPPQAGTTNHGGKKA